MLLFAISLALLVLSLVLPPRPSWRVSDRHLRIGASVAVVLGSLALALGHWWTAGGWLLLVIMLLVQRQRATAVWGDREP